MASRNMLLIAALFCTALLATYLLWGDVDPAREMEGDTSLIDIEEMASASQGIRLDESFDQDMHGDAAREELTGIGKAESGKVGSRAAVRSGSPDTVVLTGLVRHDVTGRALARVQVSLAPGQKPLPKGVMCAVLTRTEARQIKPLTVGGVPGWRGTRDLPADAVWRRVLRLGRDGSAEIKGLPAGEYVIQPFGAEVEVVPSMISIRGTKKHTIQLRWHSR